MLFVPECGPSCSCLIVLLVFEGVTKDDSSTAANRLRYLAARSDTGWEPDETRRRSSEQDEELEDVAGVGAVAARVH